MQIVEFGGWPNCIRLANDQIEVIVTTDVGPRVIRLGFIGWQNLLQTDESVLGRSGDSVWHAYGGHRLWHAPEDAVRTYTPDNAAVPYEWDGSTLALRSMDQPNGIEKELRITLSANSRRVRVDHRLVNRNPRAIELAVWAVTVMAPGGRAIYPLDDFVSHPDALAPARPIVLWQFTDMSDPRFTWGRKYIQLRQRPGAPTKQKIGMLNAKGWAAYVLGGEVFIKRYPGDKHATYTDMGCNTESFTDAEILEVETLGPLTRIEPGGHADHAELWSLERVACGETDTEIDAALLPLLADIQLPGGPL
jgi:hypothetical protein